MKKIILLPLALAACATPVTPIPTGGSKADGTVSLSYQYGAFERPIVDWDQAQTEATTRCAAWGFNSANPFGGGTTSCLRYNSYGSCVQTQIDVKYQCAD